MNSLTISGPAKDLDAFVKRNSYKDPETGADIPLRFENAVPPRSRTVDGQTAAWGTKWDLDDETSVERSKGQIVYGFNTAWGPPLEWLNAVRAMYPRLSFNIYYLEPGMMFGGHNDEAADLNDPKTGRFYSDLFGYMVSCSTCDGTGMIEGIGNRELECGTCDGSGEVPLGGTPGE